MQQQWITYMQSAYSALPICLQELPMLQKPKMVTSIKTNWRLPAYFAQRILPEIDLRIAKVKAGAEVIMNFSEDYFTSQA